MSLTVEKGLEIYQSMSRIRAFEDRLVLLYKQGKISGGVFTGNGNEALSCTSASFLGSEDILAPTHRSVGAHFAKGISFLEMARQWMARGTGGTFGKDNAAHLGNHDLHVFGIISHLATMLPLAAGAVLTSYIKGEKRVALTFIGDGATSCGDFHEALALMADLKLPVVVVIENNQYAYSTPATKQSRRKHFSDHGKAFQIPGVVTDGTDMVGLYEHFDRAFKHVHDGKGPYIIEGVTWRMSGHSLADRADYVRENFLEEGKANDPLSKAAKWLGTQGISEDELKKIDSAWAQKAKEAFEQAYSEPVPDPDTAHQGVFVETT